jgi:hypothetical protein
LSLAAFSRLVYNEIMKTKQTIPQLVQENADELRSRTDATTLRSWAISNGLDNRSAFPRYKKALLEIGIDYEALRNAGVAAKLESIQASATHELTLYSDAKAKNDRFGITDADGDPIWYGRFFEDDRDYNGEQSLGELAAAKKAVWFASKVKEKVGAASIRLNLFVDAEWLCYANAVFEPGNHSGGKARKLGEAAKRLGVDLLVEWVRGTENPADRFTVCSGFKRWQDNDLKALASEIVAGKLVSL